MAAVKELGPFACQVNDYFMTKNFCITEKDIWMSVILCFIEMDAAQKQHFKGKVNILEKDT